MTDLHCPACGHAFAPPAGPPAPDPTVVRWFAGEQGWLGALATDEVYGHYLRATDGSPVSRRRFVADLAFLGVEEVLDDDTLVLLRP